MKKVVYGVFAIFNAKKDVLEHVFISRDTKEAELYFAGYIHEEEAEIYYKLYKIGNITKDLKIEPVKVFITGGYETKHKTKEENTKYEMLKLKFKLNEIKEKEIIEALEILFDGKRVN